MSNGASWYQYHKDDPMDVIQRVKFLERALDGFMTGVLMMNEERLVEKNSNEKRTYYNLISPYGGKFKIDDSAVL